MAGPSGTTTKLALPYPTPDDTVDVARDIKALAEKLDSAMFVPIGGMVVWPGTSPPTGFRVCDGSTLPAASYPALDAVLGSSGGNITLPDLRNRVAVGASGTRALKSAGGEETHKLEVYELPYHGHKYNASSSMGAPDGGWLHMGDPQGSNAGMGYTQGVHSLFPDEYGHDLPHNNMQPYVALNYVIRVT